MKRLILASLLLAPVVFAQQEQRDMKKEEAILNDLFCPAWCGICLRIVRRSPKRRRGWFRGISLVG